ncbi:hypothetical protein Tco_1573131 [Tanacetum coccineum]
MMMRGSTKMQESINDNDDARIDKDARIFDDTTTLQDDNDDAMIDEDAKMDDATTLQDNDDARIDDDDHDQGRLMDFGGLVPSPQRGP